MRATMTKAPIGLAIPAAFARAQTQPDRRASGHSERPEARALPINSAAGAGEQSSSVKRIWQLRRKKPRKELP
jgi:hypothetical protein